MDEAPKACINRVEINDPGIKKSARKNTKPSAPRPHIQISTEAFTQRQFILSNASVPSVLLFGFSRFRRVSNPTAQKSSRDDDPKHEFDRSRRQR